MCTGIRSGIEATVHMNEKVWNDESTEAALLVDADNAFNRLNRRVALHNVQQLCPLLYKYLFNHYQTPANLLISDKTSSEGFALDSEEGCTQGDVAAMAFYSLGIKPLVNSLSVHCSPTHCQQSWYADDSDAVGKLIAIKKMVG